MSNVRAPSWLRQIADRIVYLWPVKALGTMAFMAVFFWAYFAILNHPFRPAFVMPRLLPDDWVPVSSFAMPVYASLWFYASLPPALLGRFRPLALFGAWMAAMCLFCLGIFYFFPTALPPSGIDWSHYPEMALIKSVDSGGNACPSLHVASAIFVAIWLDRILCKVSAPRLLRGLNVCECLLILWSTMATRQHVLLDVLAGAVVGALFALAALHHAFGSLRADGA